MKVLYYTLLPLLLAANAEAQSGVTIKQMNPDSKLVESRVEEAATPAAVPNRTIGDDLSNILQDHKMSELGRANAAISSQYGAEPIIDTGNTASTPAAKDEKALLLEEEKKQQEKKIKKAKSSH